MASPISDFVDLRFGAACGDLAQKLAVDLNGNPP